MTERKGDIVTGKTHYVEHASGVECWTIVEQLSFNLGCAAKYVWRRNLKGNPREDLAKALNYVNREIALLDPVYTDDPSRTWFIQVARVVAAETDPTVRSFFDTLSAMWLVSTPDRVIHYYPTLRRLIERMLDDLS